VTPSLRPSVLFRTVKSVNPGVDFLGEVCEIGGVETDNPEPGGTIRAVP